MDLKNGAFLDIISKRWSVVLYKHAIAGTTWLDT